MIKNNFSSIRTYLINNNLIIQNQQIYEKKIILINLIYMYVCILLFILTCPLLLLITDW